MMNRVPLIGVDYEMARAFAMDVDHTVAESYAARHQTNPEQRIRQAIVGKLGEIATRVYLLDHGLACDPPDFTITTRKSYGADMTFTHTHAAVHVKSQSLESARKYGLSWMFHVSDRGIFKTSSTRARMVLCLVRPTDVLICAYMPVLVPLKQNLYRYPVLESQQDVKRVLYYKDIPQEFRY